jgi:hypothetical protein
VYIDVGANFASTLRLHADTGCFDCPFEVYAFEASPLIWGYVENASRWLNGEKAKTPRAPWDMERRGHAIPPAGSQLDLVTHFAREYGCENKVKGRTATAAELKRVQKCILQQTRGALDNAIRTWPHALNSSALVRARLAMAAQVPLWTHNMSRYTLIPAAAGVEDGWLDLPGGSDLGSLLTLRRGVKSHAAVAQAVQSSFAEAASPPNVRSVAQGRAYVPTTHKRMLYRVPQVDFVRWLVASFSVDDHVFLKMDVEGAEHLILPRLLATPRATRLVDIFAWECHTSLGQGDGGCDRLRAQLERALGKARVLPAYSERDSASARELRARARPWMP